MGRLRDGMVLFHGSYARVERPDLSLCRRYKDFGRGSYLTSSYEQAASFARLSLRKAKENGAVPKTQDCGWVTSFVVQGMAESQVEVLDFPTADADWLRRIAAHRRRGAFPKVLEVLADYDVIVGKVANDQTNNTLVTYLSGGYGPYGSERAIDMCIELLLPERLEDQYCFRTERALALLEFEKGGRVWQ